MSTIPTLIAVATGLLAGGLFLVLRQYLLENAADRARRIDGFIDKSIPTVPVSNDRADRIIRELCGAPKGHHGQKDHAAARAALMACCVGAKEPEVQRSLVTDLRACLRIAAGLRPVPHPAVAPSLAEEVRVLVRGDVAVRPLTVDELGASRGVIIRLVRMEALAAEGRFAGEPTFRTTAKGRDRYALHLLSLPRPELGGDWLKRSPAAQAALARYSALAA